SRKGEWFCGGALGDIAFFQNPHYEKELERFTIGGIRFEESRMILTPRRKRFFVVAKPIVLDLAFPCFHGSYGEDGTMQGVFEMAGIPYIGCGVLASALVMSKIHARRLLDSAGIPSVPTAVISRGDFEKDRKIAIAEIAAKLPFPIFVKPNSLGSSIGVSRVSNEKELEWALEAAFQFDTVALAEKAIQNLKEVNVGVIGHRELIISQTEEPQFGSAFQTFEEKYVIKGGTIAQGAKGKTKSVIPADITEELDRALRRAAGQAFRAIGASGISRFDFLIDKKSGAWYLAEINPLPGTLQAHVWEASGIPLPQLLEKLVGYAEERHAEEQSLMHAFSSSVLQK
ncbi:MAG: hypothetical protein WAP52_03175, partial [Candidatus Sungiibacteriota bacterium]